MMFPQIVLTFLSLGFYFYARDAGSDLFLAMSQEDHLVENLQVAALLALCVVAWGLASALTKPKGSSWLWRVGSVFFLFVALEEISWGQRLHSWRWEPLQRLNHQGETNLHNLLPLAENLLPYYGACLVLATLPWLLRQWAQRNERSLRRGLQVDAFVSAVIMLGFYCTIEMAANVYFYEYTELWIYLMLLIQFLSIRSKSSRPRTRTH